MSMTRIFALLLLCYTSSGTAAIDAYPFPDPAMEVRYNDLIAELRCPQCLNTNLAGSDAMIAQDLRREVHRLVLDGHSDQEILDFMYERYGDFILYKPRISVQTIVLWLGPLVLLLIALLVWYRLARRDLEPAELSDAEKRQIDAILSGDDKS